MAKLGKSFDSGQHDDMNSGFDPMPKGEYLSAVVESDIKDTSKKTGKYIKLKFEILKGEFKGRFVWTNLNIVNPNPVAVEIAQKELATLCRACGKGVIEDTQQLHDIPILMAIKIKPAKGDYPAGNEPTGYKPATAAASHDGFSDTDAPMESGSTIDTPPGQTDADIPWGDEE